MKLKNKRFNYSIFCLPKYEKPPATQIKFFCDALFLSHKISFAKISFIFCDDEYLSKLKLEYFNKNELTDVISFSLSENKSNDLEGEVYISLDRALENSISYSQDYNKEVMRLIIHGCLHLIGFDDETEDEKEKMTLMEDKFLGLKKW
tara:strand:- start:258 stop:701 length:444 start_codon:yes stop_codon:yes gene_type:complete